MHSSEHVVGCGPFHNSASFHTVISLTSPNHLDNNPDTTHPACATPPLISTTRWCKALVPKGGPAFIASKVLLDTVVMGPFYVAGVGVCGGVWLLGCLFVCQQLSARMGGC